MDAVALTVALLDQPEPVTAPAPPTWEELLGAALGDDDGPAASVPLALQLALTPAPRSQHWRLSARLALAAARRVGSTRT